MEFLVILFAIAGAIWLAAYCQCSPILPAWLLPAGLVAYLFVETIFGPEFFRIEKGPLPLSLDRLLLGLLALTAALRWWRGEGARQWLSMDSAVAAWIGILAVNTALHDFGFRDNLPLRRLLFFNLLPAVLYFVVRQIEWRARYTEWLMWGLVGLASWLSVTGICEWRGWHGLVFPRHIVNPELAEFFGRARGPLLNPVINGMLINAGLGAMLLLALERGRYRRVALVLIPLILAGSYATLTRSVWIGAALTTGFIVFSRLDWRHRVLVGVGVAMLGLAAVSGFGESLNRFKRDRDVTAEEMSQSLGLRPLLATVAWEMFCDRPMAGFGFGQYSRFKTEYHYLDHHDAPLTTVLPYMQHNVIGSYATETGLLGLAGLLGMLGLGIRTAAVSWLRFEPGQLSQAIGLLVLCITANYLLNGMFHDVSIIPACHSQLLMFFGVVAGLQAGSSSLAENGAWSPPESALLRGTRVMPASM